ncbi:MAG: hypothetical protein ACK55Z_15370, partial [bacterium]
DRPGPWGPPRDSRTAPARREVKWPAPNWQSRAHAPFCLSKPRDPRRAYHTETPTVETGLLWPAGRRRVAARAASRGRPAAGPRSAPPPPPPPGRMRRSPGDRHTRIPAT